MVTISGVIFAAKNLGAKEITGKHVLEVGSFNSRTNIGTYIDFLKPSEYIGTDIHKGPDVNLICSAEDLQKKFGKNKFDVVLSIEVLEHVRDWRKAISSLKNVCKPNGVILITTRSFGFEYHPSPLDFWRYEINDMKKIFSDCEIVEIVNDVDAPGVFIKVRKPVKFVEVDLSDYALYNIVANKRIKGIKAHAGLHFYYVFCRAKIKRAIIWIGSNIFSHI